MRAWLCWRVYSHHCFVDIISSFVHIVQNLRKQFQHKDFKWEFVEELERPRVIRARVAAQNSKEDVYAQLVVRMKSKQVGQHKPSNLQNGASPNKSVHSMPTFLDFRDP